MLLFFALSCDKEETKPTTNSNNGSNNNGTTVTAPAFDASVASTTEGITDVSFKINSTLKDNGGSAITQHGHVWSDTKTEPTVADSKTELGATTGPFPLKFTSEIKSLKANTTYNVRAYATNDKGITYGAVVQAKTNNATVIGNSLADWKAAFSLGEAITDFDVATVINDESGNYYIAGQYNGTGKIGKFSVSSVLQDGFVAKLDAKGEPQWVIELKSSLSDRINTLDIDAVGNVYADLALGRKSGATFGGINVPTGEGEMAKITPDGKIEWIRAFGAGSPTRVDAQGNCYVWRTLLGNEKITVGSVTLTGSGIGSNDLSTDSYIARFDVTGKFLWVKQFSGVENQSIQFDVDPNGSVYVRLESLKSIPSIGGTALTSAGEFLLKLSANGTTEWVKTVHTTNVPHIAKIICKKTGEFLATTWTSAGITLGGVTTTPTNNGAMALFGGDGNLKWSIITGQFNNAILDNNGNLYMTTNRSRNSPFSIGDITIPPQTGEIEGYIVVAKYNPTQNKWLWAIRNKSLSLTSIRATELAISSTGNLLLFTKMQKGEVLFGSITGTMLDNSGIMLATIEQK